MSNRMDIVKSSCKSGVTAARPTTSESVNLPSTTPISIINASRSRPSSSSHQEKPINPSAFTGSSSVFRLDFTPGSTSSDGVFVKPPVVPASRPSSSSNQEKTEDPSARTRAGSVFRLDFTPGGTSSGGVLSKPPVVSFSRPSSSGTQGKPVNPLPKPGTSSGFRLNFTPGSTLNDEMFAKPQEVFLRSAVRNSIASTSAPLHFSPSHPFRTKANPGTPHSSIFSGPVITPRLTTRPTPSLTTPRTGVPRARRDDNVIIGLVHGRGFARNEIGLAAINMTACELHLGQMTDSHGFVKTLAKMNLFRPTEVLMPDTALTPGHPSPLAQAISHFDSEITLTAANRGAFNDTEGIQWVQKLAVVDHLNILVLIEQKYYALAAVAALMTHLENNLNIMFAPGTLRIYYQGTDQTVTIDSETTHRLELVSSLNPTGGPSLLTALNSCQTAAGSRLLRSNILEPMTDMESIRQRLDAVEELASHPNDLYRPIKEILSRFVDVERAVNQCVLVPKNPSPSFVEQRINAVVALKHILTLVKPLRLALSKATSSLMIALTRDLASIDYESLLGQIQDVLDDRVKPVKGKIGMQRQRFQAIKAGVDLMLDVCRQTHADLEMEMEEYVEELSEKYQIPLTLANTTLRGYHLQQPLNQPKKKGEVNYRPPPPPQLPPVFVCIKKQGNLIAFTTQHLLVTNERIKSVEKDIEKLTNVAIDELLTKTRSEIGSLYKLREIICQLDVIVSFAHISSAGGFCRPEFGTELVIRAGRHPILNHFSPGTLIANDTEMNAESNFHVITGANMSGKSTYIRQVMLLQIMAQIGCFVPACSASFRIVDQMFSRLGSQDRLENNASSFSLEMTEMNYIVRNAGAGSLVIIDELCNETAVDQGSAICWSLCEALMNTQAWVMITTHTPLITKLQDFYFNVTNYHMEVIEEEREGGQQPALDYTHIIRPGVTQLENYGMKLALMVAFPPDVLTRAQELIPILSAKMKPQPKTTFNFKMNKLNNSLHLRLIDIGRRMNSIPDQTFLMELQRIRQSYKVELNKILAEQETQ